MLNKTVKFDQKEQKQASFQECPQSHPSYTVSCRPH